MSTGGLTDPVRRALVTGASSGLGLDLADRLAGDGWQVVGCGRRPVPSRDDDGDGKTPAWCYVQADIAEAEGRHRLLEAVEAEGGVDLVVHNAVLYPKPDGATAWEGLERAFRVNAFAPYTVTLDLLERQDTDRSCVIVMINSDSMFHADQGSAIYASSKAALRVLTGALATACRERNAAVSTLLLGPLADPTKVGDLRRVAEGRGMSEEEIIRLFLKRSNPDLVIDHLIPFAHCYESIRYLAALGRTGNGTVCRLDGGSAGSLV